ncbi:MAG TPA: hypothetical protein VGU23_07480, partial [Acidobacteriaceae bacterium]|nr:hypothetical protein [Acidobacteriaceae bacterium]
MSRANLLVLAALLTLVPTPNAQTPQPAPAIPQAGLQLWFSADHVKPAGGRITVIPDLSGNGNDATRTADSTAPASDP